MVIKVNYIPRFNFVYKAALFSRIFEVKKREKSFVIKQFWLKFLKTSLFLLILKSLK